MKFTLHILETPGARTVALERQAVGGPGGTGRVVAEFTVDVAAMQAVIDRARKGKK